jgi:hypothetical protein
MKIPSRLRAGDSSIPKDDIESEYVGYIRLSTGLTAIDIRKRLPIGGFHFIAARDLLDRPRQCGGCFVVARRLNLSLSDKLIRQVPSDLKDVSLNESVDRVCFARNRHACLRR